MNQLPEWIVLSCTKVEPVGSRVVCNPAPTDTDQDWLCLLHKNMDIGDFVGVLQGQGWEYGGSRPAGSEWYSVRLGEDNLLLTQSTKYFDGFMKATAICKEKNLLDKKDRVAVFEEILGKQEQPKKSSINWRNMYIFDDPFQPAGWANVHVDVAAPQGPAQLNLDGVVEAGHAFANNLNQAVQANAAQPQVSSLLQGLMANVGIVPQNVDDNW